MNYKSLACLYKTLFLHFSSRSRLHLFALLVFLVYPKICYTKDTNEGFIRAKNSLNFFHTFSIVCL